MSTEHDDGTPEHPHLRDYVHWHDDYEDPTSDLSQRLAAVQGAIEGVFQTKRAEVRVLSVCAGQGHDILGVLERRPQDRQRVFGALVELEPENCRIARERVARLGVDLAVIEADAGSSTTYAGLVPADLVLLVGIMGNIPPADIERLIKTTPQFCKPGAVVIWTRGQDPALGDDIRRWFGEAGFTEEQFTDFIGASRKRMGVEHYDGATQPLEPGRTLFTFFR